MKKNVLLLLAVMLLMPWCLQAQTFPTISEGANETWYSIYSHRANRVLKVNEKDAVISSLPFDETNDDLKWKFERVEADTFKIVSKSTGYEFSYGDYVEIGGDYSYDPVTGEYEYLGKDQGTHTKIDRIFAREAGSGDKYVFKKFNDDNGFRFQIWSVADSSFVDMRNDTNDDEKYPYQICLYSVDGDAGNIFSAIQSLDDLDQKYANAPKLSTSTDIKKYFIQNCRANRVLTSQGTGSAPVQKELVNEEGDARTAQLFWFEGTYKDGFKVICNDGELKFDETTGRFTIESTGGSKYQFELSTNTTYGTDKWTLKCLDKGEYKLEYLNMHNSNLDEITLYSLGDDGTPFDFLSEDTSYNPYEGAPLMSIEAAPVWYQIKNTRSGKVINLDFYSDEITQADIMEADNADLDQQLFRFEGSYYDGFRILNRFSGALIYNASTELIEFTAVDSDGELFKFEKYANSEEAWAIKHVGENKGLNDFKGEGTALGLYSTTDPGSSFEFIVPDGVNSVSQTQATPRAQLSIEGKAITVEAEDMAKVTIYNITGTQVVSTAANASFEYTMPVSGYYVLSVVYNDGKTENIKFVIR
ncbi:T9SS type A sorting domain-containing protein [Paludibacter sp. 221]|uniref:T9SS type A sorting domain-containing protein n=1 Tax=Paludibacter sp. 221 TaxID=2302939 RepID=UPI0013D7DAD8|nr:T9SS type A sorting domain-containing protein [Paludibacter sp. 221]